MIDSTALERGTLALYGSLLCERDAWAGSLTVCCGPVPLFAGAPAAVSFSGGTSLSVGISAADAKNAQRAGGVDFVVHTLDEALRTLKNCIRQKRALGVALVSESMPVLEEMLERGVAPEYTIEDDTLSGAVKVLLGQMNERGSHRLGASDRVQEVKLEGWLATRGWNIGEAPVTEGRELREWNQHLARVIPEEDVRQRWLRLAPLYLRGARDGVRYVWLSREESERLRVALDAHGS